MLKPLIFDKDFEIIIDDYSLTRRDVKTRTITRQLDAREISNLQSKLAREQGVTGGRRPVIPDNMLNITEDQEYKVLFNAGTSFRPKQNELTLVVGDNGAGKTTLIKEFMKVNSHLNIMHVDMESSNPKISQPKPEKGITYSKEEIIRQWMWMSESHGETRRGVLEAVLQYRPEVMILDEPEQGLSLLHQYKYINALKQLTKHMTIIVTTHSKVFIEMCYTVFDVETMEWVDPVDYLDSIIDKV